MREKEAKIKIKEIGGDWNVFMKWMKNQTVSSYPNGDTDYYDYDVARFIRYRCNPKNEPIIDFD